MAIAIDLTAPEFEPYVAGLTRTVATLPPATFVGQQTRWRVVIRDIEGFYWNEYSTALVQSITWNPSGVPDEAVVNIPLDDGDDSFRQDNTPHTEVELWRNGVKIFVGPATTIRADSTTRMWVLSCKDPTWYLTRRNLGQPTPQNKLVNGSFESSGTGWTLVNGTGVTDTFDTTRVYIGTKSLKLVGTNILAARYYKQVVVVQAGPLGMPLTLSAYCYIDHWLKPGGYGVGLLLQRHGHPEPGGYSVAPLVASDPRNRWIRLQCTVNVAPNAKEYIEVQLFAIGGTVHYDDVRLTKGDSLAFEAGEDEAAVFKDIVYYAQGRGRFAALSPEKSDLRITPVIETTGQTIPHRQYYLASRHAIYDGSGPGSSGILDSYLHQQDAMDVRFEPVGRIWRGTFPAGMRTDRTDKTFTYRNFPAEPAKNSQWGIVGWTWGASIENAAGQVTFQGPSGGQKFSGDPSREIGGFDDAGAGLGGLTLELVEQAPPEARQSQLTILASARGRQRKDPTQTPQIIMAEPRHPITNEVVYPLVGRLLPEDHIKVDIVDGGFVLQREMRVAQVVLDAQADTLTVTPNPLHV